MTTISTSWNTGRGYTKHGQRIAVEYTPSTGRAVFYDYDRGVFGAMDLSAVAEFITSTAELRFEVMAAYDYNRYGHAGFDEAATAALERVAAMAEQTHQL